MEGFEKSMDVFLYGTTHEYLFSFPLRYFPDFTPFLYGGIFFGGVGLFLEKYRASVFLGICLIVVYGLSLFINHVPGDSYKRLTLTEDSLILDFYNSSIQHETIRFSQIDDIKYSYGRGRIYRGDCRLILILDDGVKLRSVTFRPGSLRKCTMLRDQALQDVGLSWKYSGNWKVID